VKNPFVSACVFPSSPWIKILVSADLDGQYVRILAAIAGSYQGFVAISLSAWFLDICRRR
jgi:hypothetical protein